LVLSAPLSLSAEHVVTADLETPVGVRRRIDVEVGSCLIEAKRDLSAGGVLPDAIEQLAGYLAARQTIATLLRRANPAGRAARGPSRGRGSDRVPRSSLH